MKQFCETLQKWNVECRADGLVPMRFAVFPLHLSKVLRLPRKRDAMLYELLHLSRKIIFPKLKIWCSKMQPLSGNQRPDLLTALMNMSLVLPLPREMHLPYPLHMSHTCHQFWNCYKTLTFLLTFDKVPNPLRLPRERHLNVQKCSVPISFLHFWLGNVLRATKARTFSTSQLPKVVRTWGGLHMFTWKRASRHNGVHLFDIATPKPCSGAEVCCAFWLEMCFAPQRRATFHLSSDHIAPAPAALASLLVDPPEPQIIGKTQCFATFLPFRAPGSFFFGDFLFLIFFLLLFSSLLWLFPSLLFICPYCRKFDFQTSFDHQFISFEFKAAKYQICSTSF